MERPRAPVEAVLTQGGTFSSTSIIRARSRCARAASHDLVTIFILPPSMRELRARLERRAEDSGETIAKRLENARNEITRWEQYDYVLINDDIQRTFDDLLAIVTGGAAAPSARSAGRAGVCEAIACGITRVRRSGSFCSPCRIWQRLLHPR